MKLKPKQTIKQILRNKDAPLLTKRLFNVNLTKKQIDIVQSIAFPDNKRVVISCMTRYGKSFCVSIGVLIFMLYQRNKKILLLSPTMEQSKIIRNYISQFIIESELFRGMVDIALTGLDRLKSEVSKKRITFKNGCEVHILSAEGTAERLMGFGGDVVILDESCLIAFEVYRSKISRMLGDNPDSILIEIGNPWDRNNQMYQHWIDPTYKKIHVGYKTALKEGRINQSFLDEQKKLLTPIEFEVLYKANFPEESVDSVFKFKEVERASKTLIPEEDNIQYIISCDVADKGLDSTVIMWGWTNIDTGEYIIKDIYSEPQSDNMKIAGKINEWFREKGADIINIDTIGVGTGVVSRVRELLRNKEVLINACHFGEGIGAASKYKPRVSERREERKSDSPKKRFLNRKAEQYFRLRDIFEEDLIEIPKHQKLIAELMSMRWETTSSGKIRIIDPDKSPDFADALVYFIFKTTSDMVIDFGGKK